MGFGPGPLQLRRPCLPYSLLPHSTQGFSRTKLPRSIKQPPAELSVASDSPLSLLLRGAWLPGSPLLHLPEKVPPLPWTKVKGHVPQKPPPPDSPWMSSVPQPQPCQRGEMPSYRRAWLQPRLITRPPGVRRSHVGRGGLTNQTTRRIKAPSGWKQSCFCKNLSLISARSEAVLKFYVFRSFSILPGLLSCFIGQFSNITPQSCQTLGVGGSSLQALMDAEGREGLELRRTQELGTSVSVRTPIAPRRWHSAPSSVPPPPATMASPSERQSHPVVRDVASQPHPGHLW